MAADSSNSSTLLLLEHPVSSYVQKVKIVLREKSIQFGTEVPKTLGSGHEEGEFYESNPRMEVPTLVIDNDKKIFDSTIILEYIEERWPDPRLLSQDPFQRARARMIEEVCDTQYEAVNWGFAEVIWFGRAIGDKADEMKAHAARHTKVLQKWLMDQLGEADWFGGDTFGWADAAVAPIVNRSVYYGLGPAEDSSLARWHRRIRERESVAKTFAEFDAAVKLMPDSAHVFISGQRKREYRDHRLEWIIKAGGLDIVAAGVEKNNVRFSWPS